LNCSLGEKQHEKQRARDNYLEMEAPASADDGLLQRPERAKETREHRDPGGIARSISIDPVQVGANAQDLGLPTAQDRVRVVERHHARPTDRAEVVELVWSPRRMPAVDLEGILRARQRKGFARFFKRHTEPVRIDRSDPPDAHQGPSDRSRRCPQQAQRTMVEEGGFSLEYLDRLVGEH
jgi:hypothetical protein